MRTRATSQSPSPCTSRPSTRPQGYGRPRLIAASLTLLAVEIFEATNGFGVMENVYDPADFVANAAGVGLAVIVDIATGRVLQRRHPRR